MDESKIIGDFGGACEIVPINKIPSSLIPLPDDNEMLYSVSARLQTVCERENGIGLSAVQVGIPLSLFIIKFDNIYRTFLNCSYNSTKKSKRIISTEGCLSIKSPSGKLRYFKVPRYDQVIIKGSELLKEGDLLNRKAIKFIPDEDLGIIFQHEIEHHLGILISDFGKEILFED